MNPGARLAHYEIVAKLGQGGEGAVYKARDTRDGAIVAVKVILASRLDSDDARTRFRREAKAAGAISHPNVLRLREVLEPPALVFDFVGGGSIQDLIRTRGKLDWREAARLGGGIARGLGVIHGAGLVHRDLKPANVLLDDG